MSDAAADFADLPSEGFARLEGVDDGPSNWHINENILMSQGDDSAEALLRAFTNEDADISTDATTTNAMVFQRADASEEWLVVIVEKRDDDWTFKDAKLAGITPGDYTDVPTENLRVLDHDQNKANLGDD